MLPGCGCCNCTCCDVTPPAEVDVAITFVDDECVKCNENVNGTYTLAHVGCAWDYFLAIEDFADVNCRNAPDPYPNFWYDGIRLRYEMWCVDATTLGARLRVFLYFKREADSFREWTSDPIPTCYPSNPIRVWVRSIYEWTAEFSRSGFDCQTDSVVLTYARRYCQCGPSDIIGVDASDTCEPNIDDMAPWYGCKDPPATVTMVPVP